MVSKVVSIRLDTNTIESLDRLCRILGVSRTRLIKEFIRTLLTILMESGEKPDDILYQVCIVNKQKVRYCMTMHLP